MRLLTEFLAVTSTTQIGTHGGGIDLGTPAEIPPAIVAIIAIVGYVVGLIRPLGIKKPRYWHEGDTTQFSCSVRNRRLWAARDITQLSIIVLPKLLKRTFSRRWKREAQAATLIPWGVSDLPKTLGIRNETTFRGELQKGNRSGKYDPEPGARLVAYAGTKASHAHKLRKLKLPGSLLVGTSREGRR